MIVGDQDGPSFGRGADNADVTAQRDEDIDAEGIVNAGGSAICGKCFRGRSEIEPHVLRGCDRAIGGIEMHLLPAGYLARLGRARTRACSGDGGK